MTGTYLYIFGTIGMIKMSTNPDSYMVYHGDTSTLQMYFNGHLVGDLEEIVHVESCSTHVLLLL